MDIVFVHNVYNRPKTLIKTMIKEKSYYPNSKIVVAYNSKIHIKPKMFKHLDFFNDIEFVFFPQDTHKIGCTNGFILGLKTAKKYDSKVVVFSHDDVFISKKHFKVFKNNIELIISGKYDVICRTPEHNYGNNYYMMEGIFMNKVKIDNIIDGVKIYQKENQIPKDIRGSISPEVFLFRLFNNANLNIKTTKYDNYSKNYNDLLGQMMGFHHLNIGKRGWKE